VAKAAGISAAYYSAIENSKRLAPPSHTVARISRALALDPLDARHLADLAAEERFAATGYAELPPKVRELMLLIRSHASSLRSDLVDCLHQQILEDCM